MQDWPLGLIPREATARALAYPLTGTPASARTRRMFLKGFPFALAYRHNDMEIIVFALAHHAPRQVYWHGRMDDR